MEREVVIILALFAMFAFGFLVVSKVDKQIKREKQQIASRTCRQNNLKIHISAESSALANSFVHVVRNISVAAPQTDIILGCGEPSNILKKLSEGSVDIVILTEQHVALLDKNCNYVSVGGEQATKTEHEPIIVWNKTAQSRERDRIIFLLQEEFCNK